MKFFQLLLCKQYDINPLTSWLISQAVGSENAPPITVKDHNVMYANVMRRAVGSPLPLLSIDMLHNPLWTPNTVYGQLYCLQQSTPNLHEQWEYLCCKKAQRHVNQHAVLSRGSAPTMTGKDNSVMSTDITTCWPGETIHSEPQTLYTWSVVPQQWVGILLARKVVTANLKTQKPATTLKFVVKEPTPKFC